MSEDPFWVKCSIMSSLWRKYTILNKMKRKKKYFKDRIFFFWVLNALSDYRGLPRFPTALLLGEGPYTRKCITKMTKRVCYRLASELQLLRKILCTVHIFLFETSVFNWLMLSFVFIKFIYSEKATKFCEISTFILTGTT